MRLHGVVAVTVSLNMEALQEALGLDRRTSRLKGIVLFPPAVCMPCLFLFASPPSHTRVAVNSTIIQLSTQTL
jgi:hypothetical protein